MAARYIFSQSCSGFPVDRYSRKQTMIAYWGMGLFWGNARPNNKKGHLIGHIKVRDGGR